MPDASLDLFPETRTLAMPAGFAYRADLIDRAEESALVSEIQQLEFAPYEFRGVGARRRVISFGFSHLEKGYGGLALELAVGAALDAA